MEIPSARRLITVAPARAVSLPVRFLSSNPVQSQSRNLVIPGRVYVITRKNPVHRPRPRNIETSRLPAIAKRARPLRFTIRTYRIVRFLPFIPLCACNSNVVSIDTSIDSSPPVGRASAVERSRRVNFRQIFPWLYFLRLGSTSPSPSIPIQSYILETRN